MNATKNANDAVILVPVYNPTDAFVPFIEALAKKSVPIIIVNDGCTVEYHDDLLRVQNLENVTLVAHKANLGKGAALKTGFAEVISLYPNCRGVVTADADGQHSVDDIIALLKKGQQDAHAEQIILGTRHFDADVPLRSRFGNVLTRIIFYMLTAIKIEDTQTGLRYIPLKYCYELSHLSADGYAFEMEMLLWAKQNDITLAVHPIETIYVDHNKGSHFKPFTDSVKIYAVLLKQVFASSATALVDLLAFAIFFYFTGWLFLANAFSRAASFPVYFYLNRDFVFKRAALGLHPVPKLIAAIIISGFFSYFLQYMAQKTLGWPEVVSKICIETLVFFINFVILRDIVYKKTRFINKMLKLVKLTA